MSGRQVHTDSRVEPLSGRVVREHANQPPTQITLDFDATDDATHGRQQLSLFHGDYEQQQSLTLLVFDGDSQFPLAGWLRPGTAHASWGTLETLQKLVSALRAVWPDVEILVRGDSGFAVPELYEFCAEQRLKYVIGDATNPVLKDHTHLLLNYVQA